MLEEFTTDQDDLSGRNGIANYHIKSEPSIHRLIPETPGSAGRKGIDFQNRDV